MPRSLASAPNSDSPGARIELRDACRSYGATAVIHPVSLTIDAGESVALVGPNGSGKTTLLMLIAGFETPSRGEIVINGRRMHRDPPHLRDQGFVFHHRPLFPHLSLAQNLAYPLQLRGLRRAEIQMRIGRMLERFDLQDAAESVPGQLSAVQCHYGTLARALIFDPALLLMDEPLGAFDPPLRQELQREIRTLHTEFKVTLVYATRSVAEAHACARRIVHISDGRINSSPRDTTEDF